MAGEKAAGGTNVGSIWYEIGVDTKALIDAERQADRATGKMATSLTAVAEASKMHAAAAGMAATAVREASKANEAAATSANKAADAAGKAAKATQEQAMSAKQLSAAMRNVPAQVTDIVSGLATGQSPLTVLLQQGGQLKDMFGGVGNAARALGTYIAGLVTPVTAAVAAVGALALGWLKGREEMAEFNRTLAMTGGQSGVTAEELNGMAASLGNLSNITRAQAAGALNTFVQAGVEGEAKLRKFTEAAIRLEQAGGQSVEKTAKAFADLEKDPLAASLKLNDATNYLTESVYRQIKSLVEQGRTVEAATVAQNAYADAVLQRTPKVEENLGLVEKAWKAVAGAAKGAWDAILNAGREDAPDKVIAKTRAEIERLEKALASGGFANTGGGAAVGGGMDGATRKRLEAELAARKEELHTLNRTALVQREVASTEAMRKNTVEALAQFDKAGEKFLTDRVRMEREIAQAKELGRQAGASELEIQQRITAIRKSYEKGGGSARVPREQGSAQDIIDGLAAKVASEWDKIDIIENQALRETAEKLKQRNATAMQQEEARTLILQQGIQARAELLLKERAAAEAEAQKQAALELRAEQERQRGRAFAEEAIAGDDPVARLELRLQRELELNDYYASLDQANAEKYAAARIALERDTAAQIAEVKQREREAALDRQAQTDLMVVAMAQSSAGQVLDILRKAGKERSALGKALFLAERALAVATIILNTELGAAKAVGIAGPFGIPLATAIRATGYASAGMVAGLAVADAFGGGRQYGGPVAAGSMYRVGEGNRPEMFVGDSGRSYMIPGERGKVIGNGDLGGGALAPIVNIYQAPAETTTRTSRDSEGRWVVDVMLNAVADDLASGGKTARALQSRFNLRA